jgi:pentatricopeptide repeat domain-containing protein 1
VIEKCKQDQQWKPAVELLREMPKRGLTPNVVSYTAVLNACGKSQWEIALYLLDEMNKIGLRPNVMSYSSAISACAKGGQWEIALDLWDEMKEKGINVLISQNTKP